MIKIDRVTCWQEDLNRDATVDVQWTQNYKRLMMCLWRMRLKRSTWKRILSRRSRTSFRKKCNSWMWNMKKARRSWMPGFKRKKWTNLLNTKISCVTQKETKTFKTSYLSTRRRSWELRMNLRSKRQKNKINWKEISRQERLNWRARLRSEGTNSLRTWKKIKALKWTKKRKTKLKLRKL